MPIQQKIQKIREDALSLDWSTDKSFPKGGKMIPFVSGEKIKRQFAPLWSKHGVDMDIEVIDYSIHPELTAKQYNATLSARVRFILTDTEDGTKSESIVLGFAPADSLHGPKIAVSFAYNTFMTTKFQICDKLEDVMEDTDANVMHQLSQMSVPEVGNDPRTENKAEKVSEHTPAVKSPSKDVPNAKAELTKSERTAIENTMSKVIKWLENGEIVETQYEEIKEMCNNIIDSAGVSQLLRKVRAMQSDVNSGKTEVGF